MNPYRFSCHSKMVQSITTARGWLTAARYTNLRDVKTFQSIGFIDIDWKNYNFYRHLAVVEKTKPFMTVARDIENIKNLDKILIEAYELSKHTQNVVIVPKCLELERDLERLIPENFLLGYSVPTKYGGTKISVHSFKRKVHLLGGSPSAQLTLANLLDVYSFDCNRFTLDARFGDYFDGERFRPHPRGGYEQCIIDSVEAINSAWERRLRYSKNRSSP